MPTVIDSLYAYGIAEHNGVYTAVVTYRFDGTNIDVRDFSSRADAMRWALNRIAELDRTHR